MNRDKTGACQTSQR